MAKRVEISTPAPDFALTDWQGRPVRLSDFRHRQHVILVFNRGFM
jgi:peroxiredoxin